MDIVALLTYFGFTPSNITPLVIIAGIAIFAMYKHTNPIRTSLQDIREKFAVVESRVTDLWRDKLAPGSSPRQLNEKGETILESSGIKAIIDDKRAELLAAVRVGAPKSAYDAENCIYKAVMNLPVAHPELIPDLKEAGFKSGVGVDGILFVGSIYLRNLLFPELGFEVEELE